MKNRTLFFGVVLALVIAIAGFLLFLNRAANPAPAAETIVRVDDHPLYVMHLAGDYGFKEFLKKGVTPQRTSSAAIQTSPWACTVFGALNAEWDKLLGRNFDWDKHPALLLFTDSPEGYASVSMVDIFYLGFTGQGEIPSSERERLRQAAYMPFDGMNEKGLAVGMMAVSDVKPDYDPGKVTLSSLNLIRLMLDYAQNVDEALALLQNYNVDFSGGPTIHYLIADKSGHSAMVEYQDAQTSKGGVLILRNDQPWQVSTNFQFALEKPQGANSSCWRYNRVYQTLAQANGKLTQSEALTLLQNVSQDSTQWSVTYNLTQGTIQLVMDRHYDQVKTFSVRE